MLRARIREEPRIILPRFQSDLNIKIIDRLELISFHNLNDLRHNK